MNLVIALVVGIACGSWGYHLADKRGRSHVIAVIVCGFFGLIGVGVYALATRKSKRVPSALTELAPMP